MTQKSEQFYVEVVDKNFQANIEADLGIKSQKQPINQNQFLQNSEQQQYNNKPATPLQKSQSNIEQDEDDNQQLSDEEPVYKLQKSLPKQNQKQRLIEQNIKLKAQIYELAKQLDEILQKDRSKKKKFGLNVIEEEDEIIRDKKLQIKKQQLQIMELKNKIFVAKRQLDSVFNNLVVTDRQNLIIKLQRQLRQVEKQRDGLLNVTQEQDKMLKVVQNQEEYGQKLTKVHNQYHKIKTQTRQIILKTQEQQRILKKQHQIYINKLQQLKDIESKLSLNKQKSKQAKKTQQHIQTISEEMIHSLESEVKEMQNKKKQGEKIWQEKIRAIDAELYKKRIQEEKKMLMLREKEKQLRLSQLRIRQLRKMFRENQLIQSSKKTQDMDMSQFRHKRNIRYIEK